MSDPVPPTNARVLVGDRVIPVEVVYNRQDGAGAHIWTATCAVHLSASDAGDVRFQCDQLPPATYIELNWQIIS